MFKKHVFAVGAALALSSGAAFADFFTFDPTGTAGPANNISGIGLFDQAPGNSLAQGFNGGNLQAGNRLTVLYQANLSTAQDGNGTNVYSNGGGGHFFTFVAGFGERVTSATPDGSTAAFAFDTASTTNFFRVYANTVAQGNNLTGTGFTAGTLIMSGTFLAAGFSSNFTRSGIADSLFDASPNGDQYGGFTSDTGSGSTRLNASIGFIDSNYFPDLVAGSTFSFFNTSQITPFTQVDPSRSFTNQAGGAVAPNLGRNNGFGGGTDFQLQADANQSFTRVVPEPESLALLGLGLSVAGLMRRRRKAA